MPTDTEPDDVLAGHLAAGLSIVKAARRARMSERTARRRLEHPGFRARVDTLRAEIVGQAVGQLSASMTDAAAKLVELMGSTDEKVQLAAAREILGSGLRARQLEDVERQLAALAERLEVLTRKRKGTRGR